MDGRRGMHFTGMAGVLDDLAATNAAIDFELDSLTARLAPLAVGWTGEAAAAYERARREWDRSARLRSALLARIRSTTADVVERHRAASSDVHRIWGAPGGHRS